MVTELPNQQQKPKASIKKNYLYNLVYQIFNIIVPLITTPYVSRVLLPEGVGIYSFSSSIISYFTIFAALGFNYYAQREVSKYQDDLKMQSIIFWEILICRLLPVSISLITNIALCSSGVYGKYNTIMWILSFNIFAISMDIGFLFQGKENFKSIVVRSVLVRIVTTLFVFLFVRGSNDVWVYALINSLSVVVANLSLWFPFKKTISKVRLNELKPLRHLKGTLILFLPTIAASIYLVLDKTLIGLLITDTYSVVDETGTTIVKQYSDLENGYYEQSEKIVKMAMTVITAIGIVMVPRNTHEIAIGNYKEVVQNIYKTCSFVLFLGVPMVIGLICVSDFFVPWFFGDGFEKCALLMKILSPLIVIIGLSNVFGMQLLVPKGKDKQFALALIIGAVTNLVLNVIFIFFWWSVGAAIATISAELIVTLVMAFMVRKDINFFKVLLSGWRYYVSGGIMFVSLFFIAKALPVTILNTFILVIIGIVIYFSFLAIIRDPVIINFYKTIVSKIKNISNKHHNPEGN